MRFLIDPRTYNELRTRTQHPPDCCVRAGEYPHHVYRDGIKFDVAVAIVDGMREAEARNDKEALHHLMLHKVQLDRALLDAKQNGTLNGSLLGDALPTDEPHPTLSNSFVPSPPATLDDTGLNRSFAFEMILRTIYFRGRPTGGDIARALGLSYRAIGPLLQEMRQKELVDITGQKGMGDIGYEYILTPQFGVRAVQDALKKTEYAGAAPVPFKTYVESITAQTIKNVVVTRRNIREAFSDLIITDAVLNEIGPAINSASSIFLFGFPGNGKTSIAERITRLLGDDIYIPYAVEVEGQIIKVFDGGVHELADESSLNLKGNGYHTELLYDMRWVRVKRPVVITGGELTLPSLDLIYNEHGRFYEAPFQMKANSGIFMIDDFGRQQVRPMDLLNRWIVPLEKRYDYLTTVSGKKLEVPFDQLLIFSTNLDPNQLADEAFLRRIKYKIEIRDPDEAQWREIWKLVCKGRKVEYDARGVDYMIEKWMKSEGRPFRMCQPRDILDQMISLARYNMEQPTFSPDLIDAACMTYFVRREAKNFGAKVRLE